jgi:hypothetical protein
MSNISTIETVTVKGLTLPPKLVSLVESKRWRGRVSNLAEIAPSMDALIDLCPTYEMMESESDLLTGLVERGHAPYLAILRTYLGSKHDQHDDLPWLDEEKSVFVAVGDYGDDTGFALDYRLDADNPRVVLGFWGGQGKQRQIAWQEVASNFNQFLDMLTVPGGL